MYSVQVDLVFIVDQSTSSGDWNSLINFVISILENLEIGDNAARIGFISFAENANNVFFLNAFSNRNDIINRINSLADPSEAGANAQEAFSFARTNQFTSSNGDRTSALNVVVYLTYGQSSVQADQTVNQAQLLKTSGVTIFAIGIGGNADTQEVMDISSLPQILDIVYWLPSGLLELETISDDVSRQITIAGNSRFLMSIVVFVHV